MTATAMKPHRRMEFESILRHLVVHNTDSNMLCRLFDDRKYIFLYIINHQEYSYLGKKREFVFFRFNL